MTPLFTGLIAAALGAPIDGRVLERGTADPIAEVTIQVDGITVLSDATGRFQLDLEPGTHRLSLTGLAHRPQEVEIQVPLDGPLRLWLEAAEGPLEIVVESFRPVSHATRHVVDAEMAFGTPGTHSDTFRLVQAMPGVNVTREFTGTGQIPVRGSSPGDNRYYLDGVELPYIYHFNQYASVFPTQQIGELELFPSNFGVRYGDAVGAVMEATSKAERPTSVGGSASFSTIMVGGSLQVPLPKKWWLSGSGRRSYHDLGGESSAQYLVWPRFHDFTLRAERTGDQGETAIFAIGSGDQYVRAAGELDLLDPLEASESPSFTFERGFEILGARHRWRGPQTTGRVVGALVHDHIRGTLSDGSALLQRTGYATSRLDVRGSLTEGIHWEAGWELRGEAQRLEVSGSTPAGLLVASEAPALARGADVATTTWRVRAGLYGEAHFDLGRLRLLPGLRLASDTLGQPILPEPRLAVHLQLAEQTRLEAMIGRYHQAPETEHLVPGTGNPDLPTTSSWQAGIGLEQTIANRLEISVDTYLKELRNPLAYPVDGPAEARERGRALGVELVSRYRLRERVFVWGWVGWSRALLESGEGWESGSGDQPLSGGLVFSWQPTAAWQIGLRYRIGSGLPYTPVEDGLYDGTTDSWAPIPGSLNSARLPLYQKIDAQVAHTWTFNRWDLTLTGELWYVPKPSAQLYPTWNYDYREQGWVVGPSVLPLLSARATF